MPTNGRLVAITPKRVKVNPYFCLKKRKLNIFIRMNVINTNNWGVATLLDNSWFFFLFCFISKLSALSRNPTWTRWWPLTAAVVCEAPNRYSTRDHGALSRAACAAASSADSQSFVLTGQMEQDKEADSREVEEQLVIADGSTPILMSETKFNFTWSVYV